MILQVGIKRVVFSKGYKDGTGIELLEKAGIEVQYIPFEEDE
jgi:dCMP deaminase